MNRSIALIASTVPAAVLATVLATSLAGCSFAGNDDAAVVPRPGTSVTQAPSTFPHHEAPCPVKTMCPR